MSANAGDLVDLFHHRCAVAVLAEVRATPAAGRVAALGRRLGAGREVLKRTLATLEDLGLARRNEGYGHPLRPEVLLTARGRQVGEWCRTFLEGIRRDGIEDVAGRKWSMPVLLAVHRGSGRFSELEATLPGVTARALALALKDLQEAELVDRVVVDDYPPRVEYAVSRSGRRTARRLEHAP
jgi:DNA-binding HxlR family transcriptional regulator